MKTKFSKTDLGCVIGDEWDIFGNRILVSDDGLHLTENGKLGDVWFHPKPENPVLPFPFSLEQFRAFCDWHPTFQWEAIGSVFTNDDGSLDDAAIGRLNRASGAADLVRAVLATHDAEFQMAWGVHEQIDLCKAQIERWERLEQNARTPSEAIASEGKLAGLRAELARLLSRLSAATQEQPQAATTAPAVAASAAAQEQTVATPVVQAKARSRTWWDISAPYIVGLMKAGQYATAKELFRALEERAGTESPFDRGSGNNRGSLYVREISQSLSCKTVQNNWVKLRELAQT